MGKFKPRKRKLRYTATRVGLVNGRRVVYPIIGRVAPQQRSA
jgi:hypothetical protein